LAVSAVQETGGFHDLFCPETVGKQGRERVRVPTMPDGSLTGGARSVIALLSEVQ